MFNDYTATMQVKAEEESITAQSEWVLPQCESLAGSLPYNGNYFFFKSASSDPQQLLTGV